jgi:hypothetical protein
MKRILTPLVGLAVLLLPTAVRADYFIPFGYDWTPSTTLITGAGGGQIHFTDEAANSAYTPTNVDATHITTTSPRPATHPETFTNVAFGLTLHLTDSDIGLSHDLSFNGTISGKLSSGLSTLALTFNAPLTQTFTLVSGNVKDTFTVEIQSPVLIGHPGATPSAVTATITAVRETPEPSTMALSGLGLAFLGLARWRKRTALALA